ncbi:MAG: hypothetical protein WC520_00565 [Candidatus Paceibacterota bacterium]
MTKNNEIVVTDYEVLFNSIVAEAENSKNKDHAGKMVFDRKAATESCLKAYIRLEYNIDCCEEFARKTLHRGLTKKERWRLISCAKRKTLKACGKTTFFCEIEELFAPLLDLLT